MDTELVWGILLTLAVIAATGGWFYWCGYADRMRQARALAKRTLVVAGTGFVLGLAFLTSDLGTLQPAGRLGMIALTTCCGLLLYAAGWGLIAADDQSVVIVNLTGRALLLTDPELAPFYTLPAPQPEPAKELPPALHRTFYVVSPELGRLGAARGRTDLFLVDARSVTDFGGDGPLLVRRLQRAATVEAERADC